MKTASEILDLLEENMRAQAVPIAQGVLGILFRDPHDGALIVNYVWAEREGAGDVGRWLDALPAELTVRVIAVTSDRLAGMLARRGYKHCHVLTPSGDRWCPAYVRRGRR